MLFPEKQENQKVMEEIKQEIESDDDSTVEKEERNDSQIKDEVLSEDLSDEDIYEMKKKKKQVGRELMQDKALLEARVVFVRLMLW